MTEFRDIPRYSNYQINEDGDVWSKLSGKIMRTHISSGYKYLRLLNDANRSVVEGVHRLMALAFLGDPPDESHVVNHKDGDKLNNNPKNIEWTTRSGNNHHAFETGLNNCGRLPVIARNRLTGQEQKFWSTTQAAHALGFSPDTIHYRIRKRTGVVFPDNIMFKYDDGSEWPVERFVKVPTVTRLVAYNVLKDETILFNGYAIGQSLTGVSAMAILKAVRVRRVIPIKGWLFRHHHEFDGGWPIFDDVDREIIAAHKDRQLSSGFIIEKNGEKKLLPSIREAKAFFGKEKHAIYDAAKHGTKIDDWCITVKKISKSP